MSNPETTQTAGSSDPGGHELPGTLNHFFGATEPPPLPYVVDGVIPEGYVSILFGPGGTGKSMLALHIAICVAIGVPALGFEASRCSVLFVDYELSFEAHLRRAAKILRGLGTSLSHAALEGHLAHYEPSMPLSTERGRQELRDAVARERPSLVVVDSLSIGAAGADLGAAQEVMPIMKCLDSLGASVLATDHPPKGGRGTTPIGSVFKFNVARAVFSLSRLGRTSDLRVLRSMKHNFGSRPDEVYFTIAFEEDRIRFAGCDRPNNSLLPPSGRTATLHAIRALHRETEAPVEQADVVRWNEEHDDAREIELSTVQNHFSLLKGKGLIEPAPDGQKGYVPVEP